MTTTLSEPLAQLRLFAPAVDASPYRGLVPYTESDSAYFFGRSSEQALIVGNLLASRLLLVYGASGVGKTSVLRAGVVHALREIARHNVGRGCAPELAVAVVDVWKDDPLAEIEARVLDAVRLATGDRDLRLDVGPAASGESRFQQVLRAAARAVSGDVVLILDQFEEYFLYHPDEEGEGTLLHELPRVLNDRKLGLNVLISMRDDSVAKLDRFQRRIPDLLENYVRLEYMGRDAACLAIVEPLRVHNRLRAAEPPVEIEEALVDRVLSDVEINQIDLEETGRAGIETNTVRRIETPYLQLVMLRVWKEEMQLGSRVLRLETLEKRLGGARNVVRRHLDEAMDALTPEQQDMASEVFRFLVTPGGTKYAYGIDDLAGLIERPRDEVKLVVTHLAGREARILRDIGRSRDGRSDPSPHFQIYHDVLATAVLEWRRRYLEERQKREVRARERRRGRLIGGALLLLVMATSGFWAWKTSRSASAGRLSVLSASLRWTNHDVLDQGFKPLGPPFTGKLGTGAERIVRLSLPGEGDYAIVGRCDEDCQRMHLRVDGSGGVVTADSTHGGGPTLHFLRFPRDSVFQLTIEVAACNRSPCFYAVQAYQRTRPDAVQGGMKLLADAMREEGYRHSTPAVQGLLRNQERRSERLNVPPGKEFKVVAACDQYCDLDLELFADGTLVAGDSAPNRVPIAGPVLASAGTEYRLVARVPNCISDPCRFTYQVFFDDPVAVGVQQVVSRLTGELHDFLTEGMYREPLGPPVHGLLPLGGVERTSVHLVGGERYLFATVCGGSSQCGVGLELSHAGQRDSLDADLDNSYHEFVAPVTADYQVLARMGRCDAARCVYAYRVYHDVRRPDAVTEP